MCSKLGDVTLVLTVVCCQTGSMYLSGEHYLVSPSDKTETKRSTDDDEQDGADHVMVKKEAEDRYHDAGGSSTQICSRCTPQQM